MNVSKGMLIEEVATKAELTKVHAARTVDALLAEIIGHAKDGNKVIIQGFGTFSMKTRAAWTGRNPQTGLPVDIAASTTLTFKAAKAKA